jgi:pimeloyl-ACP methyl ester carboxylesterase
MTAVTYGREKGVRFGTGNALVGVLTEAAPNTASEGRPGVIFLNSGILHRVGSCRLHVRLARAMSAAGFHALRFDYSGIGDSDQRRDSLPFEESAVLETKEAMDYLAKAKGVQKFILIGLCSGADMAHETAATDDRVGGLVLLDAWAYKTLGYKLRRYGPKLLDIGAWKHSISVRLQEMRGTRVNGVSVPPGQDGVEYEVPKYVRVFPPRDRVANDIRGFVSRNVQMYYLWTGGLEEYNHRGQHEATFSDVKFGTLLREEWLPDADHIVTGLQHQEYVTRNVLDWAQVFGGRAASQPGAPRDNAASASSPALATSRPG